MFEKGKLSFWDIGTYLMIGCFSFIIIIGYLFLEFGLPLKKWLIDFKDFSGSVVILLPIIFILLGMLIEPLANTVAKYVEKIPFLAPKENKNKNKLIELISKSLPDEYQDKDNPYRFCKAIVELKSPNSNHEIFLSRFGFYRSLSFIFISITILNLFLLNYCSLLASSILSISLSVIFLKRSQTFLVHMSNSVFYNYIALVYGDSIIKKC